MPSVEKGVSPLGDVTEEGSDLRVVDFPGRTGVLALHTDRY
jgi:hypothetical protein